jgi:hypothetical protein
MFYLKIQHVAGNDFIAIFGECEECENGNFEIV